MTAHEAELLTPSEVAALLRVPLATVRAWRYRGTGPRSARLNRHVRYRRTDVDAWIEEQYAAEESARQ